MGRRSRYPRHFSVRVTGDELRQLHTHAKAAGLSLARYLVEVGLAADTPPAVEERRERQQALFYVRKVGVNLNQLTRRVNSGAPLPVASLEDTLRTTAAAIGRLMSTGDRA